MNATEFDKVWPWIIIAMVTVLLAFGLGISVGTAIALRKETEWKAKASGTNELRFGRIITNASPDRIDIFFSDGVITIKAKP